ncbi:MAG: hypothetical protein EPN48_10535 [Microbacteriaceae bacterium]|nr:MAG: hypothetical protein EPN48_10535 [Microbacteriaceae bacterium]
MPQTVRAWLKRWWVQVLAVFVASRLVSSALLLVFANVQGPNPWTGAHPGFFQFSTIWDGRWYQIVAGWGYPAQLPLDAAGNVAQNAWAFMPGYPWLVSAVMFLTRMPWEVASVVVSVGFGLGSALLLYRLFRLRLRHSTALFAVALFCFAPTSPLLQLAYAESMYLFFLILALYLLLERRYWGMLPAIALMAFTRPSGLAFALAMGLHVVYRWVMRRRDLFSVRDRVASVVVTIFSGLAGLAWPAIAAAATGSITAYTDTELTWRADYIGRVHLLPFAPWVQAADWWFNIFLGLPAWLGYLVLALVIAIFAVCMFLPAVRRLGVDLRIWVASYAVYLLAVFFPQSSTFRLLMPMFPLLGALAVPKNRMYRTALIMLSIAGQVGWLLVCWGVDGADWSPP